MSRTSNGDGRLRVRTGTATLSGASTPPPASTVGAHTGRGGVAETWQRSASHRKATHRTSLARTRNGTGSGRTRRLGVAREGPRGTRAERGGPAVPRAGPRGGYCGAWIGTLIPSPGLRRRSGGHGRGSSPEAAEGGAEGDCG